MLDKYFDFSKKEKEIYQRWEKAGVFRLDQEKVKEGKKVFDITMPPPNANGELHLGHCYGHTMMDILGRYQRLNGRPVWLIPGKDHAGIQTQVVYERKLTAEGVDIKKMSRKEFWDSCYDFCMDRSNYMREQEKLIGIGADFENEVFTLNPKVSKIVYETFEKMWNDGLVYRGDRIIHWSVYSQTSISDVEVEYKEAKGHLWHIKYPLVEKVERIFGEEKNINDFNFIKSEIIDGVKIFDIQELNEFFKVGNILIEKSQKDEEVDKKWVIFKIEKNQEGIWQIFTVNDNTKFDDAIVIATTRPETMLGDSAIAVHPLDPRYSHLVGKKVIIPIANREIEIIADDRVEIGFGSGAVKITPAHDFLDYDIGKDHHLEQIQVIDKFGKMTSIAGEKFVGLTTQECREKIIKELEESGNLILTEEITHKVPISERGKDVIEPLISTQWFIKVDKSEFNLKQRALDLLNSGKIKIFPERMRNQIAQWLENLNDWNISRQILWGHQMPVWYKNKGEANEEIKVSLNSPGENWEQETDTFDTWFSSGQWPFSTLSSLGFLDLDDIENNPYFPTDTMVMGRDILFFWACRMLLLSAYRFNEVPWKNILFTGLIRDSQGQKMSKSKGNGVEPKEMLQKYGADALRIGLIVGSSAGLDIKFNEKKLETYSKYLNKIWNAGKLLEMKIENDFEDLNFSVEDLKLASSSWILSLLGKAQEEFKNKLDNYEISNAFDVIYHFSWDIFCSWYLEISKIELDLVKENSKEIKWVMQTSFLEILKMLHPFMPFFTEEIYFSMNQFNNQKLLAQFEFRDFSQFTKRFTQESKEYIKIQKLIDTISFVREFRINLEKPFSERLNVYSEKLDNDHYLELIQKMVNICFVDSANGVSKPYLTGLNTIEASEEDSKKFRDNLEKLLDKKKKELETIEKILTPGFKAKADPELVEEREKQYKEVKEIIENLERDLKIN